MSGSPNDYGLDDDGWWYSTTGEIVRYAITGAILGIVILFFVGGYLHAVQRLKHSKEPLAYHKWLVSNSTRTRYGMNPIYYGPPPRASRPEPPTEMWNLQNWNYPPPPPAYNAPGQELPGQEPPEYFHAPDGPPPAAKGQPDTSVHVQAFNGYTPHTRFNSPYTALPGAPPVAHVLQPPPTYR